MKRYESCFLLCITASLLAACGGSDSEPSTTTTPSPDTPSVTSITAGSVLYKKSATVTVTGQNLDKGITAKAIGCSNLTEQPGGTSTSRSYSCVPVYGTAMQVSVSATSTGALLQQTSVPVPLPQVTLLTSMGTIVIELRPDRAKPTVDNFLQYVNSGFYSNTVFHRVMTGFVVQGGGYDAGQTTTLKPTGTPIILETAAATGLSNIQGSIAMARQTAVNSATSQFFINTVDNASLDTISGGYAVFGSVIQGMNVAKAIEAVAVDTNSWPTTPVIVTSASQTDPISVTTPAAPTGVIATGGSKQVTLTWTTDPGAASYNIYTANTSGATLSKSKVFPPVTLTSLVAETTYSYTVTAVNRAGESAPSATVSATTLP